MTSLTALVRRPSPRLADGLVTPIDSTPVDADLALAQWERYVAAVAGAGWHIVEVPPIDDYPPHTRQHARRHFATSPSRDGSGPLAPMASFAASQRPPTAPGRRAGEIGRTDHSRGRAELSPDDTG
ncbi:MAG: hypothetical protein ACRDVZ_12645, partial [Jiangellaceae bacterium]